MADAGDFFLGVLIVGAGIGLSFVPGLNLLSPLLYAYGTQKIIDGIVGDAEALIQGIQFNALSSQAPIPVVYGQFRVGMRINDTRLIDATDAATPNADPDAIFSGADDFKILGRTGALCVGSEDGSGVESISEVKFYSEPTAMIDTVVIDSALTNSGVLATHENHLKYTAQLGTDAQQNQMELRDQLGWGTTMDGRGLAYIAFFMLFDLDLWRGVPHITCLIKGNKLYDPRTSLFQFPNYGTRTGANPALVILDYLTSKRYGGGVPYAARDGGSLDFIDEASFIAAANYCEQAVSIPPSGTEDRFGFNGAVNTGRVVGENLADMLATCRGQLIWQGGKFRLVIGQVTTAETFELTEDNILSIEFVRKGADIPNSIQAAYVETVDGDFVEGTVLWPLVGDTTLLDEDNGVENRSEVILPFTTGRNQAIRTIMVLLKEARQDVFASIVATQAAMQLEVGNVVKTTHEAPGWVQQELVVREMSLTIDGRIQIGLQKYDAASYTLDSLTAAPSTPTTNLPNPYNVDPPSALVFTSDATTALRTQEFGIVPRILLAWTASPDAFVHHYDVQFKLNADSEWRVAAGNPDLLATDVYILGVEDGASYDVRVRTVNRVGQVSTFIELTGQIAGTVDSVRLLQGYLTPIPFVDTVVGGIDESILPDSTITHDTDDWGFDGATLHGSLAESDAFSASSEPFFFNTGLMACPTKTATSFFEVGLANPVGTPAGSADQTMKLIARLTSVPFFDDDGITDITVELYEGTTLRATLQVNDVTANSLNTLEYTLSDAEVDAIGDHDNLRIRVTADMCLEPDTIQLWALLTWVKVQYINTTVIERGNKIDFIHVPSSEVDEYDLELKWDEGAGQQTFAYTQAITAGQAGGIRLQDAGGDFFLREGWFDFSLDVVPVGQPGDIAGFTTILEMEDEDDSHAGVRIELTDLTLVRADYIRVGSGISATLAADGRPLLDASGSGGSQALTDLTDVTLDAPLVREILMKSGADWINRTVAEFGTWLGQNGTAALPTWSFAAAISTGAYRHVANGYAISTNGVQAMALSAAQIMSLANPLPVGSGGLGVVNPTLGRIPVGAGTSPMSLLAPGAVRGFIRSNGAIWERSLILAGDLPAHTPSAHVHDASEIDTGTLSVARGGTGVSNPTGGRLLRTNGGGAFNLIDEGAAGGILVSSGTQWIRASVPTITSAGVATFVTTNTTDLVATGFIRGKAGSAGAPSLIGPSVLDTGIYFPTAVALGISVEGVVRMLFQRVDADEGWIEIRNSQIGNLLLSADIASAIDWDRGNVQTLDNDSGTANPITMTGGRPGFTYILIVDPGSGASASLNWPSGQIAWLTGAPPGLSTSATLFDKVHLLCIATDLYLGSYTLGHTL